MALDGTRGATRSSWYRGGAAPWILRALLALLLSISLACSESDLQLAGSPDRGERGPTTHVDDGDSVDVVEIDCTAGRLCEADEARAFAASVQAEVIDRWEELATRDRAEIMMKLVNEHLVAAGVPALRLDLRASHDANGTLAYKDWRMILAEELFATDRITREDAARLAGVVWHEARHAEQFVLIVRLRAGEGLSPSQIADELPVLDEVVRAVSVDPLVPGSPEGSFARRLHDSYLGDGRAHRRAVHAEVDEAKAAYKTADASYDADPTDENTARREAALQRYRDALDVYKELPEEADAYAVGGVVASMLGGQGTT